MTNKKIRQKKKLNISLIIQIASTFLLTILIMIAIYLLLSNPIVALKYRLLAIGLMLIILLTIGGLQYYLFKKKAKKPLIIVITTISILFSIAIGYLDFIFIKGIKTLNNILVVTDNYIVSYIYVPIDSDIVDINDLTNRKIGLQPEETITTNQMIIEGLTENNVISYEKEVFSNYFLALDELLIENSIDAIALDRAALNILEDTHPYLDSEIRLIATFTKQQDTSIAASTVNTAKEPFVVLINGVDIRNGNLNQAANADVIMLAAFNPQTLKLSLISIPRDSYLPVSCRGGYDKITHSGSGGVSCTVESLENAFNIKINYYIKVNFFALIDIVNTVGGIETNVPFSFCEQNSQDLSNSVCLNAGYQTLNGEEALALSRHRKTLQQGDIARGANQQLVIQGLINKLTSGRAVTNVDKLLNVAENNIQTNMNKDDMYGIFSLLSEIAAKSIYGDTSALQINTATLSGRDAMIYTPWAGAELYYYTISDSSISAVTSEINRTLGLESYPLPDDSFAFNANIPFEQINLADPIGNPSDMTSSAPIPENPNQNENVRIFSSNSIYTHYLNQATPNEQTIINQLGIYALDQDDNEIDVSLDLSNVDWSIEGEYTITATANLNDKSYEKHFIVTISTPLVTEIDDSVTIMNNPETTLEVTVGGYLDIISSFGISAFNQHGEQIDVTIIESIDWNSEGIYTVTIFAEYGNASSSKTFYIRVTPIVEEVENSTIDD